MGLGLNSGGSIKFGDAARWSVIGSRLNVGDSVFLVGEYSLNTLNIDVDGSSDRYSEAS
jgi:hypothetical protein